MNAQPSPTTSHPKTFLIVGAGLAGSLLAIYLAKMNHRVLLYERRPDPRAQGFIGGRSINLALSVRGLNALQQVNLETTILQDALPMPGRMIHSHDSELTFQPYSKDPNDAINSISRSALNITLLKAADEHNNVTIHFDQRCVDVDLETPAATFLSTHTGERTAVKADAVIAADGAFSAVRAALQKTDRFNYSQDFLEHGYKELAIPPTDSGDFTLDPKALHIWPRSASMMIALPNKDRSFTCTLFWPFVGHHSFASIKTADDVLPFFRAHYPDAVPIMPTLVEDYMNNPASSLVTIRCAPWNYSGKIALIGDAAHAVVPFYGQGMNAAFEDCRILADCIHKFPDDLTRAFDVYARSRKPNADAIADMALTNFIEMRDKVGSRLFLLKKRLEKTLHALFPKTFLPLYNMVSFSNIPYAEAARRAKNQQRLICAIAIIITSTITLTAIILLT